ncbi:MAG: hypothetical protein ACTHJP_03235 [Rhodanobacteraceae bacterium]
MASLPFLIAFAVTGGTVTFAGAVATPTAASVPDVAGATVRATAPFATQLGRFNGPPRVVSLQRDSAEGRSELVVTYL